MQTDNYNAMGKGTLIDGHTKGKFSKKRPAIEAESAAIIEFEKNRRQHERFEVSGSGSPAS